MQRFYRQLVGSAALVGAAFAAQAHVTPTVIDFEGAGLTGLYFAGDSFSQSGFRFTVDFDAGIVDNAASLGTQSPTGNATQFYTQLNQGGLIVERDSGFLFDLTGFDAAFVPLSPAGIGTRVLVALGVYADDTITGLAWLFGNSASSHFPFLTYDDPGDFSAFTGLKQVQFFDCAFDGVNVCSGPTLDNGQFAIDNIRLNAIPEPATFGLVALALLGLGLRARRGADLPSLETQ